MCVVCKMAPWSDVFRLTLRITPIAMVVGAGFETFMFFTGFWKVAIRKEAERIAAAEAELSRLRAAARAKRGAAKAPGLE